MEFLKGIVRTAFEKTPTRIIGYGSTIATFIALWAAAQLKITLPPEILLIVAGLGAAAVTETIRKFVYSKNTTQELANAATYEQPGTVVDIGQPPDASPPLPPEGEG